VRQVSFTLLVEFYGNGFLSFLKTLGSAPFKKACPRLPLSHGGGRINDGGRFDALS
jgi:hypothetical protein